MVSVYTDLGFLPQVGGLDWLLSVLPSFKTGKCCGPEAGRLSRGAAELSRGWSGMFQDFLGPVFQVGVSGLMIRLQAEPAEAPTPGTRHRLDFALGACFHLGLSGWAGPNN